MTVLAAHDPVVERLLEEMTDREKVGQMVMGHPQYLSESERRRLFEDLLVGSAIVRAPSNPAFAAAYNNRLQELSGNTRLGLPVLVGGDFAAGTWGGLPLQGTDEPVPTARDGSQGATAFPQAMGLGATRSVDHARTAARITAEELRSMGYHWNFAPIADVNTNPSNPVIGCRAFGERPDLVSKFATVQIEGYQGERAERDVVATAKHFPGHGDADVDSHAGLPIISHDKETIEATHLPPFETAIDAGVDTIMTAHVVVEAFDSDLPATLSRPILTDLLRDRLGFDGLVVTDSMAMDAIEDRWGRGEAAVKAAKAGADVILAVAKDENAFEKQARTAEALLEAIESGDLSRERVDDAVRRVLAAKRHYGLLSDDGCRVDPLEATAATGSPEHRATAAEIGRESITLIENAGVLPFDDGPDVTTLVVGATTNVEEIGAGARLASDGDVLTWWSRTRDPTDAEIERAVDLTGIADQVLVVTWSGRGSPALPAGQVALVEALSGTDRPVAALAQELPYDIAHYPDVDAYLCAYTGIQEGTSAHLRAAGEVVFGAQPGGRLPVTIEGHFEYGHGLGYDRS